MSTDNTSGGAQNDQVSDQDQQGSGKVAYETHKRLLGEKKKLEAEHEKAMLRLAEIEEQSLKEQGKYKEAAELNAKKAKELEEKLKATHSAFASKALKAKMAEVALQNGLNPTAIDAAYVLGHQQKVFEGIEFGDEYEVSADAMKEAVLKMQSSAPFLFQKTATAPKDVHLNGKGFSTSTSGPDISKMSTQEMKEFIKKQASLGLLK